MVVGNEYLVQIQITKGMLNGEMITLSGENNAVEQATPGDIEFVLVQRQHPQFIRKGHDLALELTISATDFFQQQRWRILELPSAETYLAVQVRSVVAAPVRVMDRRWSKIKCNLVCSVCDRVNKNSDTKFAEGCLSIRTSYHVLSLSFILSPLLGIVSSCTVGAGIVECRFGLGNTPRDLLDHAGTMFLISNFNLA